MSYYLVFTKEKTTDQNELDQYFAQAGSTIEGHPANPIVFYGQQENLEGEGPEGIVIIEFPDRESALGWYNSEDYKRVREHRFRGASYRGSLVKGVNHS